MLANASLPWELKSGTLSNDSKPSWELAIEKYSNHFDLYIERVANATSDHFDRVEERLDELTSHFGRIQEQLHVLCEVISSNDMQVDPSMNSGNVASENGLYFDQNDESNLSFNEEIFVSHDCTLGANLEPQEVSLNNSFFTPS